MHYQNLKYVLACVLVIFHGKPHTFLGNTVSVVNLSQEHIKYALFLHELCYTSCMQPTELLLTPFLRSKPPTQAD